MMDKFLLKIISVFISAITLCSCGYGGGDGSNCTSKEDEVFVLKDTDFLSFPFAHQPELFFLYNADSGLTIPHQFKLTNAGVAEDLQIVTVNDDYYYCDFEADIHFKRRIFVNDLVKHTALYINIKPVRVVVSSNGYYNHRYSLSRTLVAEVVINNEAFYIDASVFKSTKNYYVGDITFGGKNFSNIYQIKGSKGGDLYLSLEKIAHIKSGNRTWTNLAN